MPKSLVVPSRFNGPMASGNGGYSAGALASFLEGTVEVSLRSPVPLDTSLDVVEEGGIARLLDGDTLVAEAKAISDLDLDPPAPVDPGEARRAADRYRGEADGLFSSCFVCGRAREDGFGVFAGEVEGRDVVASPWTPPSWTAGSDGSVRPEFIWSVLDCPTYFAAFLREKDLAVSFLARLTARLDAPVVAGEEHVVIAWPLAIDGRKRQAGAAVLSPDGEVLAVAKALLIEPRG